MKESSAKTGGARRHRKPGRVIGVPTPRSEGPEKVSGRAVYATDVTLPGMLWCRVLRSPIPYGRIKRIDVSRAAALPGVRAVAAGDDVRGLLIGRKIYDMPVLADGVVRFVGEKVAAVAAETEEIAEEALGLIEVEYEELDPVLDPLEALKPSAPLLHPGVAGYRGLLHPIEAPSNVFFDMSWGKGDVDAGFREADLVVENTFRAPPVHQAYIEPHACVVRANPSGPADIWACSKVPFALREQVAAAFRKSPDDFVVHPCYIGGCFGGKGDFMDVPVCYLLSLKSGGLPVKMVMDYAEEFVAGNPRHGAIVTVRTGVKRDGRLVAHRLDFLYDSGAYAAFKPQGYLVGPREAAGPYRIPNVLVRERIVYTNKVPCGHMRAPGDPQGFFANESQMDLVARRLGLDPIEFRKRNLMRDGDVSPIGHVVPHIRATQTLDRALAAAGYRGPKGRHVGRGVAVAQWIPLGGECRAVVTIDEDGGASVATAMVDQGAGTYTAMRQIAAEELGLDVGHVRFEILDTSRTAPDTGVGASRATRIFGNATLAAAQDAGRRLREAAAKMLGVSPERLRLAGGAVVAPSGRRLSYGDVVKSAGGAIRGDGSYRNFASGPEAAVCVQVAEVEIDVETGKLEVRRFTTAHSTGTVINPLAHQGQIDGGVVMGIGYAVMEELPIEEGRVVGRSFAENKIPSVRDIPELRTVVDEIPVGNGPYGGMSIGEPPVIPGAAAIANAVHDAVGVRIRDLPITAEKIFNALAEARRSSHGPEREGRPADADGRRMVAASGAA
ncbi:MAG TPA: xanthine dehydrogenase family protein molybdopterin-binding subunit [candidate division Zixibacteria bacterium]|nr:xanthine dehydrogenase family protein molybdopterin-binding subunit [candidate division Zixibacteria bacterium]